jgi:hypothetical protein
METPRYILLLLEEARLSEDRTARTAYGIDIKITDSDIRLYKDEVLRVVMSQTDTIGKILAEFNELIDPEDK